LNQWQIHWTESLADFEFQIYYKKDNENDEINALSRWSDHEEVKWVYTEILSEDNRILTKNLAAMYRVKYTSLINNELIWDYYNDRVDEHFEVKQTENFIWRRYNISDFKIKSWNTSLNMIHAEETRFKEINDMMK
jgi:hypothetical protein